MKFSILPMLFFLSLNAIVCHGQQVISDDQAIKSLQHFYISYVKNRDERQWKKNDSLLNRYSTPRFTEQLKGQDEAGYDFLTDTNGLQIEMLKSLTVTKDVKAQDIYMVSWHYMTDSKGGYEVVRVKLKVIKTSTGILIDRVTAERQGRWSEPR